MRSCFIVSVTFLALALTLIDTKPANAQWTCNHTPTGDFEIFLEVLDPVLVKVTNLETAQRDSRPASRSPCRQSQPIRAGRLGTHNRYQANFTNISGL